MNEEQINDAIERKAWYEVMRTFAPEQAERVRMTYEGIPLTATRASRRATAANPRVCFLIDRGNGTHIGVMRTSNYMGPDSRMQTNLYSYIDHADLAHCEQVEARCTCDELDREPCGDCDDCYEGEPCQYMGECNFCEWGAGFCVTHDNIHF